MNVSMHKRWNGTRIRWGKYEDGVVVVLQSTWVACLKILGLASVAAVHKHRFGLRHEWTIVTFPSTIDIASHDNRLVVYSLRRHII